MRPLSTITNWIVLTVVGAIVVSHLLLLYTFTRDRQQEFETIQMEVIVRQIGTQMGGGVMEMPVPPPFARDFMEYVGTVRDAPPPARGRELEKDAIARMLPALRKRFDVIDMVAYYDKPLALTREFESNIRQVTGETFRALQIGIQLKSGKWLTLRVPDRVEAPQPVKLYLITLGSMLVLSVVAAHVGRRLAHPIRQIAHSARRIVLNEPMVPIPETGPADLRQTIRAINVMGERTVKSLQLQRELLGGAGHDLRTPLAAMRVRMEMIDDEVLQSQLLRSIDELQTIADGLIATARASVPSETAVAVDAHALAQSYVEDRQDVGHAVSFDSGDDGFVTMRPNEIRRALGNLIDNAIRYGEAAEVSVEMGDAEVRFVVTDKGPGIPADMLDEVMEPFVRLEGSRNSDTGGLGLGLAIARRIAEAHGGKLNLFNRDSGGLRAELVLPAA